MRSDVSYLASIITTIVEVKSMTAAILYDMIQARRALRMRLLSAVPSSGQVLADYDAIRLPGLPDADCVYQESSYLDASVYVTIAVRAQWELKIFSELFRPRGCVLYTDDTARIVALASALRPGLQLPTADGGSAIVLALVGLR